MARSGLAHVRRSFIGQNVIASAGQNEAAKLAGVSANAVLAQYLQLLTFTSSLLQPPQRDVAPTEVPTTVGEVPAEVPTTAAEVSAEVPTPAAEVPA